MSNRENFLQADDVDSKEEKIEMMIKKHEDFDKAIGNQEVSEFFSCAGAFFFYSHQESFLNKFKVLPVSCS
jgi:hypothetical protein